MWELLPFITAMHNMICIEQHHICKSSFTESQNKKPAFGNTWNFHLLDQMKKNKSFQLK